MVALAVRTALGRSTLSDCRDVNVTGMDSKAVRFFEVDVRCGLGEETDADMRERCGSGAWGGEWWRHEGHLARRGGR